MKIKILYIVVIDLKENHVIMKHKNFKPSDNKEYLKKELNNLSPANKKTLISVKCKHWTEINVFLLAGDKLFNSF